MIFQCKMCGGDLDITPEATTGTCQYCGSIMTLPRVDDERIAHLFNRANHYRMKNEFDQAATVYQNIIAEDKENAEAYWGLCLCRYGIEYVKDPVTEKRIPTCHRTCFSSVFEDEDYLCAFEHADSVAQSIYRREAEEIDIIQKKILDISSKEEPYDIFICYKEENKIGERTLDSVIAQDIYYTLEKEGYRVFFAKISLEDKVGKEYEPYIFAAINSAPIMLVVGTKPEYMNAVWVKNEWSRFLDRINHGEKKTLIPLYKGMSPYDMPEEFVNVQSLNMEKIGFIQDLLHGIQKILSPGKTEVVYREISEPDDKTNALVRRMFLFLEDKEFEQADNYCERILDLNPECGEAYLGKLMVKLRLEEESQLGKQRETFDHYKEYEKIMRFGSTELKERVKGYLTEIQERWQREKEEKERRKRALEEEKRREKEEERKRLEEWKKKREESERIAKEKREREQKERKERELEEKRRVAAAQRIEREKQAKKLEGLIKDAQRDLQRDEMRCGGLLGEMEEVLNKRRMTNILTFAIPIVIMLLILLILKFDIMALFMPEKTGSPLGMAGTVVFCAMFVIVFAAIGVYNSEGDFIVSHILDYKNKIIELEKKIYECEQEIHRQKEAIKEKKKMYNNLKKKLESGG